MRHEPLFVCGLWSQVWALMQAAKAHGIEAGDFHPDMALGVAGGLKGLQLPADYQEQIFDYFGHPPHRYNSYGMSELTTSFPRCEAGRYHQPPCTIALVLDGPGERLLNQDGEVVKGRFGFVDLTMNGRWGGLISGDAVEIDFAGPCACGRPGPTINPAVTRYVGIGEEDKIGCAGTIDAYIRGAMAQ
jgi:hypothetical protein